MLDFYNLAPKSSYIPDAVGSSTSNGLFTYLKYDPSAFPPGFPAFLMPQNVFTSDKDAMLDFYNLAPKSTYIPPVVVPTVTSITATEDNLKVVFDGTDKYEVFLVPDSSGQIGGSGTVFACTAFTYGTNYNNPLQNIATDTANTEADLSGTGATLLTNNHLCNGTNVSSVLLAGVQEGFHHLHRVTWYKAGQTFTASTDYKIMQLKQATSGTKLVGKLELYYGDGTNGDQKKYVVSFSNDATTIAITATTIANPPPFRKYYVKINSGALINGATTDPYYRFYNDAAGTDEVDLVSTVGGIGIYKRATYVFEPVTPFDNSGLDVHPFGIQEDSAVTQTATDLFKIQGGQTVGTFNNIIKAATDKVLMFTTENYSGSRNNIVYYCTKHSTSMAKAFYLKTQDITAGYNALVDSDRHIEAGQNIRLEIEGEEIKL